MRSKISGTVFALALFVLTLSQPAQAQSDLKKVEVGAHFSSLSLSETRGTPIFAQPSRWEPGFGGRFTYNATELLSVEAELNYFPRTPDFAPVRTGNLFQGLFGAKIGGRGNRFGVFGKIRPGFVRFSRVSNCDESGPSTCDVTARTELALDIGGVVEFYKSSRFLVRVDVGDTIIRYKDITLFPFVPEFVVPVSIHNGTTHNFQLNAGIGFRF